MVIAEVSTGGAEVAADSIHVLTRLGLQGCTVITIAHRLNTIMDYDKVMVLGAGSLLEFDAPQVRPKCNWQ